MVLILSTLYFLYCRKLSDVRPFTSKCEIHRKCLFIIFNVLRDTSLRSSPTDETGGCRHACGCSIQNRLSPSTSLSACKRDARHNRARVTPPTTYVWFIRSNRCQRYAGSHMWTTGRWPVTRDRRLSFALTLHVDLLPRHWISGVNARRSSLRTFYT